MNNTFPVSMGRFNSNRSEPNLYRDPLRRPAYWSFTPPAFLKWVIIVFLFSFPTLFSLSIGYSFDVPAIQGYVNDDEHLLTPAQRGALEDLLRRFEEESANRIVVLIVSSLEGGKIEPFSMKAAESWKVGRKEKDNGAILTVAVAEKKARILAGRNLAGTLTDAKSDRIRRQIILPHFRENDFYGGISEGLRAIIAETRGASRIDGDRMRPLPRPERLFSVTFIAFLISGMVGLASWLLGGLTGGILGVCFGIFWGMTWVQVLLGFLIGGSLGLIAPLLLRLFLSGAMNPSGRGGWYGRTRGWSGPGVGGDWTGFSAGGGSFGGGGASGRW